MKFKTYSLSHETAAQAQCKAAKSANMEMPVMSENPKEGCQA